MTREHVAPMRWVLLVSAYSLAMMIVPAACPTALGKDAAERWTIYVINDNCPDYTWGLTEAQTRQAYADVVKGHLDEMSHTDKDLPDNRDHYNAAVAQEIICFLERYPDREAEVVRRIREGRLYISPYLCNSLWGFQDFEGALRTFYPARRLERRLGLRLDCAHHIELPSLPWGTATILAECGIKRLSVPYYNYDSRFGDLQTPPVFRYEGPDGSRISVAMDRFACGKASYMQGAALLNKPDAIGSEWISHYQSLGQAYPLRSFLASGTHGDIALGSGSQSRGFAEKIALYNARAERPARLVNATLPQFWAAVESQESKSPWLPTVRGDFGHSWDLWPVTLAKYAADMREGARRMLAAETFIAVASHVDANLPAATSAARQRAEWCWAMLSDHAWNGTEERNQRHNAELRRQWAAELHRIAADLQESARKALKIEPHSRDMWLFNSLSCPRRGLVRVQAPAADPPTSAEGGATACQIVEEDGQKALYFVSPVLPGFSGRQLSFDSPPPRSASSTKLAVTSSTLESPFYRARVDPRNGGLSSLVHRQTGKELLTPGQGRALGQSVFFDGQEHILTEVRSEIVALGPVLARLRIHGFMAGIEVTTFVTVYADLDQVDFDVHIHKPRATREQRLCQVFPLLDKTATLRVATPAAIVRPRRQPNGDLLPGADERRFAVQEYLHVSSSAVGVTLAPLDAFALRLDLDPFSFEALGNDQNYRESTKDQDGVTDFRFRYSLQARPAGYDGPSAAAFARGAATPLLALPGRFTMAESLPRLTIPATRAVATCLKPADELRPGGHILRLWETAGQSGPVAIDVSGYRHAFQTDLLERDQREMKIVDGNLKVDLKPFGVLALRLLP